MAFKNGEDADFFFLNLVDDSMFADWDFPHVVLADLRNSEPGEGMHGGSLRSRLRRSTHRRAAPGLSRVM